MYVQTHILKKEKANRCDKGRGSNAIYVQNVKTPSKEMRRKK